MGFKRILIDTNICIDAVIARKPFAANALRIINLSQSGKVEAYVSAHSFDTIFYVLQKKISNQQRYALLRELRSVFNVAAVSEATIDAALQLEWPDLEDAIHYQAAVAVGCDAIITRNPQDFRDASIPVLSAGQILADF
jgi:predicted nucleic acid-binding protein